MKKLSQAALSKTDLSKADPKIFKIIRAEKRRQQNQIELIASENIVSQAVLTAQGSVLTNKYAEGYPGKRYYGGCRFVDEVETEAMERAQKLFDCGYVNVQPHSGAQANQAVFLALLNPGDCIMGMSLNAGGHLTHGAAPNLSGKWFKSVGYPVHPDDDMIDFAALESLALQHRPKLIIAGGSAYPRIIDFQRIGRVADQVGAYYGGYTHFAGLVAAGYIKSLRACPCYHDYHP
jgi:glycine hydroxymethyltransferase